MFTSFRRRGILLAVVSLGFWVLSFPWIAVAKDNWVEVKSPHFTVLSNAGEGEARRIADHFEQFREMFHSAFPTFRVDLGKPLLIMAVKNEDGLKVLLPGYWEVKGRVHPAGYFMPGEERDFVALRTDIETENPYQVVYHEYTHAIMDMNSKRLPIWLNEGLAEFFANSLISGKDVRMGMIDRAHLQTLQTNRLIPIDELLQADAHSPYYNEENHAGVFYAESWAIVHYLMLDADARKRQLLSTFFKEWNATNDQMEAAEKTFGDLKKFARTMESYARQQSFYYAVVPIKTHADPKSYASRPLSPAEVAANSSLFLTHTARFQESQKEVEEALREDPNLALAHEASGLLSFQNQDFASAEKEFKRATELSADSSPAFYYLAVSQMRKGLADPEQMALITASLEKAIALNPQFAPAYAALSQFYSMRTETYDKAVATGKKAIELEPGNLRYAFNFGIVLINVGKASEAKLLADRMQAVARDPQEIQLATSLRQAASMRADMGQSLQIRPRPESASSSPNPQKSRDISIPDSGEPPSGGDTTASPAPAKVPPAPGPVHVPRPTEYRLEGKVTAAECKPTGELVVTLSINTVLMKFHAADWKTVEITPATKAINASSPSCSAWKAQRAEVVFHGNPPGEFDGELVALHFR